MRRLLDVAASAAGLLLLSPLLLVVAAAVKLSSPGPALHRGERVGRGGKLFTLYKFRSMRLGPAGPAVTAANDPRVTPVGRLLRRTKLDELPQLINVLRGDMSLVGPRPEALRYVALYDDEQRRILSVRPGMTSPASLLYRREEEQLVGEQWERHYIETIMPAKLRIDLEYLARRTVVSDLRVIAGTLAALLR
ncbi:MAG TPA: sugar transferase [Thermoanaerobaculia bacterium]|nr:sugar transferase [Thermoanaerobaculia bacterium]